MSAEPADDAMSSSVVSELRRAARGGALTAVASSVSAAMGFVLILVLARQLGAVGSGVVLQAIAAFTIGLSVARLGMDTTAVWLVPRLRLESPELVRGACVGLLGWAAMTGLLGASVWWAVGRAALQDRVTDAAAVAAAISAAMWALPIGAVLLVALAATRGFGGVLPFNLIGNVAVPAARPVGVLCATMLGGSAIASTVAWVTPLVPAALASVWLLHRQVSNFEATAGTSGRFLPSRALQRRTLRFALPRTVSSVLEQSMIWFDVVLVGLIAGSAAAGVYGAAARFVGAGMIVLTALRIVVAPRFSAYLAADRYSDLQHLFAVTASWILLFGTPIYVLLAFYAPTVLGWLGSDFGAGVSSMVLLCLGAVVLLAGGNVQSLLLMSGHSGWAAVNKCIVFTVSVSSNVILIPRIGLFGAAVTWAACVALDTALAIFQVHRLIGIKLLIGRTAIVGLASATCAAAPSLLLLWLLGNSIISLIIATLLAAILVVGYSALDRHRLQIAVLLTMLPRARSRH